MFGPWIEVFVWLKGFMPRFPRKLPKSFPKLSFNFILCHYLYLISLTIILSVILYPGGNLAYIDALFLASGSATQSGLNTINLNDLHLYQQIAIMLICCIATPIFIHTFVVFLRLYWFEKRFQNVVLEAQKFRRTRERTKTKSQAKAEQDVDFEEKGVGGRKIVVVRPGNKAIDECVQGEVSEDHQHDHEKEEGEEEEEGEKEKSSSSNDEEEEEEYDEQGTSSGQGSSSGEDYKTGPAHRDIAFADEVKRTDSERRSLDERIPTQRTAEQHISFVENQRTEDRTVLYIPGPREIELGHSPQQYEVDSPGELTRKRTNDTPITPFGAGDGEGRRFRWDKVPIRRPFGRRISFSRTLSIARDNILSKIKDEDESGEPSHGQSTATSIGTRGRSRTFPRMLSGKSGKSGGEEENNPMPYLSYEPTIGRNSAFANLSEEQREELGGIEYRALKTLAIVLCCYYVGFHTIGMICLLPWIEYTSYGKILPPLGVNKGWWGVFTSASLFNDLGMTLTPNSMESFATAIFPLLFGSFLIIIGNTGFPIMLRFTIWTLGKMIPKGTSLWEEMRFLLDHPRRCFTLLFPNKATWWLFWVLVLLNGIDLIFYIVLDLNDPAVTKVAPGLRVLDGWFQAASTRTAGFAVVNLAKLHPAIQVSYLIMMYISVLPIAISVRRTNVYEEKSLGIWGGEEEPGKNNEEQSYVSSHLRRQLSFDLWFLFLGLFIIAIAEGNKIQNSNNYAFTTFSVLFEIVSAYGTVGLSLGYPGTDTSFSAQFSTVSKLVIIAMQIRGRHRGLPYALDKAILLPSEGLQKKEEEDATMRAMRRNSLNIANQARTQSQPRTDAWTSSTYPSHQTEKLSHDAEEPVGPKDRHSSSVQQTNANRLEKLQTAHQSERDDGNSQSPKPSGGWTRLISSAMSAGPSKNSRYKYA